MLEGKDSILDGPSSSRTNPIAKCAVAAMKRGYHMFAVQLGGQCFSSATAPDLQQVRKIYFLLAWRQRRILGK